MRYVNIIDIRDLDLYRNTNVRLVYMHLCMAAHYPTGEVVLSRAKACEQIGVTPAAWRHAIEQLTKARLIEVESNLKNDQLNDQETTKEATKKATKIKVYSYNELQAMSNQESSQGNNQESSQGSSQGSSHIYNINNTKKTKIDLTQRTRARIRESFEAVKGYCGLSDYQAKQACEAFIKSMDRKHKTWEDETDMLAHLYDWAYKHYSNHKKAPESSPEIAAQVAEEVTKQHEKTSEEDAKAKFIAILQRDAKHGNEEAKKRLQAMNIEVS